MQKDLGKPEISEFCGDGSCGCGCDELMDGKQILSKEELQKNRETLGRKMPIGTYIYLRS